MRPQSTADTPRRQSERRSRWWVQVLLVYGALLAYRVVRAEIEGPDAAALANALGIIRLEQALGIAHERLLQGWLTAWEPVTRLWNVFYGLAHELVAVVAFVILWRRDRVRYRTCRNIAGWMLVLGLVGFAAFPVTPPRLLPDTHGYVDTGVEVGGVGPIQGATEEAGGNRYAAVPSLHVGRAAWVAFAVLPVLRRRRSRALVLAYPAAMVLATVVTANHWLLDGAAGVATLAAAVGLERAWQRLRSRARPPIGVLAEPRIALRPIVLDAVVEPSPN